MSLRAELGYLPLEVGEKIGHFLKVEDLEKPVSTIWACQFSTQYRWKALVQAVLQEASSKLLTAFELDAKNNGSVVDYKVIYKQLNFLKKIEHRFPADLRQSYRAPHYHLHLLIFCLADCNYLTRSLPAAELSMWFKVAIFGNLNIAQQLFFAANNANKLMFLRFTLQAGNLPAAQEFYSHILSFDKDFQFHQIHMDLAARSGNVAIVTWMLTMQPRLSLRRSNLIEACASGSKEMIVFFTDGKRMEHEIDYVMFCQVINSGNSACIDWFVERFDFPYTGQEVDHVIKSGNLAFVQEYIKKHNIKFERSFLKSAIKSLNFDLFNYFLQTYEADFVVNHKEYRQKAAAGDAAAQSEVASFDAAIAEVGEAGSVEILKFCHQELGLPITQDVLEDTVLSGDIASFEFVRARLPHALQVESFTEGWLKACPNPALTDLLRAQREVNSLLNSASGVLAGHLDFTVLNALLDVFTYAKDYDLNVIKMRNLIGFLEGVLPAYQGKAVEEYALKNVISQIKASPLVSRDVLKKFLRTLNAGLNKGTESQPRPQSL